MDPAARPERNLDRPFGEGISRPARSTRWPLQMPASKDMTVQVRHRLPCVGAIVDHQAITRLFQPKLFRELLQNKNFFRGELLQGLLKNVIVNFG